MAEYRYTNADRLSQLKKLESALPELIRVASSTPAMTYVEDYRLALAKAVDLQKKGFTQNELSALARAIPDVFDRHKDWMPPMQQIETGEWVEHEWWTLLDEKLQPVLSLARTLQMLGYY
ncbi:hypothetical protein RGV33_19865 [Pseudomonas sp. Bout1]|uniref:hypothetical protein n=1 Tax=Pseudomonas sp. Bout1 TaxID=3048600 RepID=UPI002AB46C90|nr:hypothetical protein [Pseudomonas sp. Bout1]MDY7533907.1 hypothetical protein [Pseudomonas sp. Bout1]MEB0188494.1 hypothetical protein [Pseudomonas sp. Bout1]